VIGAGRDAGLLGAATRVSAVVLLASWAANQAFQPVVARVYASRDLEGLQREVTVLTRRVAVATLVVGALVAALAPWLLGLFGPGFADGASALRLLCLGAVINAAAMANISLLTMTEHERAAAAATAAGLVSTAALCVLLIPPLGAAGGAYAVLAGTVLRNAVASRSTWTRLGLDSTVLGLRPRA
jgi:O-antigen/teichoic acid export membrane protein